MRFRAITMFSSRSAFRILGRPPAAELVRSPATHSLTHVRKAVASCLSLVLVSGCGRSERPRQTASRAPIQSERVTFELARLDGQQLPTAFADPRGRYTLRAAHLTLDPNGDLWLETDLVPDPDTVAGRILRKTTVGRYQRAADDSLVFPTEACATPEFFGKLDGAGGLRLVAHPLPRADGHPSAASVAAEHGGPHVWEFQVR